MRYSLIIIIIAAVLSATSSSQPNYEESEVGQSSGGLTENKLSIGGEIRVRTEFWDNRDFATRHDPQLTTFQRSKLHLGIEPNDGFRFYFEAQDSRYWGEPGDTRRSLRNLDIHQAFARVKLPTELSLELRLGRQELEFGSGRLIGRFDWDQTGRSFDSILLNYGDFDAGASLFYSATSGSRSPGYLGENLLGCYLRLPISEHAGLEPYSLFLHDYAPQGGHSRSTTLGARYFRDNKPGWSWDFEGALQVGKAKKLNLRSFFISGEIGYFFKLPDTPSLLFSATRASGDNNPQDDNLDSFQNLFGDNHRRYGYMDFIGLSNMRSLGLTATLERPTKWNFAASLHYLSLDNSTDEWNDAYGNRWPMYGSSDDSSARFLGLEADMDLALHHGSTIVSRFGLSVFQPGKYVQETIGHTTSIWFHVGTIIRF